MVFVFVEFIDILWAQVESVGGTIYKTAAVKHVLVPPRTYKLGFLSPAAKSKKTVMFSLVSVCIWLPAVLTEY